MAQKGFASPNNPLLLVFDGLDELTKPVDLADELLELPRDERAMDDQRLMDQWIDGRLRDALSKLPPSYRMIVVMREMEGLSTNEVAAITGLSDANVKTRLHRARLMLRRHLEGA